MRAPKLLLVLSLLGLWSAAGAEPAGEIVVSMRYLQQTGTSHAHLYLYRVDGKLLRQLTNDDRGQDFDPVFSPDGETIVFTRALPGGVKQCWSVEPRGGKLRQVPAPDWYTRTKSSPAFDAICVGPAIEPGNGPTTVRACTFAFADGKAEVIITPTPPADPDIPDHWDVSLRVGGGAPAKVGELPGYSAGFLSRQENVPAQSLLQEGALSVVFCFTHLNSTDGETISALDLDARRVVRLSPNWTKPFPLPGEPAFLTLTENRYVPYGDGKHTANCFYVERWDAGLKAVRYAEEKMPGVCKGASMYRPGQTPRVVTIRLGND